MRTLTHAHACWQRSSIGQESPETGDLGSTSQGHSFVELSLLYPPLPAKEIKLFFKKRKHFPLEKKSDDGVVPDFAADIVSTHFMKRKGKRKEWL